MLQPLPEEVQTLIPIEDLHLCLEIQVVILDTILEDHLTLIIM